MAKTQTRHALEIDGTRLTLAQLREFEASRPFMERAGAARERMQLSVWVRRLKQATACRLRSECRESLPLSARHGPFWMKGGGHDRTIWSWQEYWAKVRYIHLNPVRAGLCRRAEDWEWSSASDSLRQPRAGSPTLSPPPEALVDLLWWTPTA
jgi:hypothetical protein